MATRRMVGLCRVDNPPARQHGYSVRFTHKGTVHSKWFGDWSHGGAEKARQEAEWWIWKERRRVGSPVRYKDKQ